MERGREQPGAGFDPPRGGLLLPYPRAGPRQLKPALGGNYTKSPASAWADLAHRERDRALLRVDVVEVERGDGGHGDRAPEGAGAHDGGEGEGGRGERLHLG